ncbi:lantibiotic dehydratase family protein [Dysgonomonas sp. Marseille-P4677]|uniref:lantibiotic dehydratase family protein n=1 Tax=Dysgonomonas sp. Marseille-P4677 TaxID=2364790 RepID=UPI00191360AD|nr:lantibiotic dehydratase family protein [Dysgonomonas sp. Marseille-P4677]MBK5722830.1 lantibiotic dehydratase family protein [Dysgonomonas sp. Marseille-P4677]
MYKVFPSFIFRTPVLSINYLTTILNNTDHLLQNLSIPQIQEAIYLASPVLYKEMQKFINGDIKENKKNEIILLSLVRYISRMAIRCTPFGLFAGCGIGQIGNDTNILVNRSISRKTRLDMHYLSSLYDKLTKIPEIKENIKYYTNTSLYKVGRKYRYIEVLYVNSKRKYQIAEVEQSSYLNGILNITEDGAKIKTIITALISKEITQEDAVEFIDELINSQIIIPELYQSVIGDNLFDRIIKLLEANCYTPYLTNRLIDIKVLLDRLDSENNPFELYKQIIQLIEDINAPYEERFIFQVDAIRKSISASLSVEVIDELKSVLTFLNKITPIGRNETLHQFQQYFYNRYEDREVPLLEVLDPEIGIGYPSANRSSGLSPLIDDLVLPEQGENNYNKLQEVLYQHIIQYSSQNRKEIELTDEDFNGFKETWNDLPPSICVVMEVIRSSPLDTLIKLKSCGGSSGANMLARFAYADKGIKQFVKNITNKEQELAPDVILAEIVHSPESRVGNILSRPHLRNYELIYLSESDLPKEQTILASDLLLSIRQERLVLRSKKLNKAIIPRLTTAHNYHNNTMPVYHFLCDMQVQQGRDALYFDWEQGLDKKISFLPRVRYKNVILSSATWIVNIDEIKHFFEINEDSKLLESVKKWRNERYIPRYVLMPDNDNELFVDWESSLSIRSLFFVIKKERQVKFTEFLFEAENAVIKDEKNSYTNECIVVFHKKEI